VRRWVAVITVAPVVLGSSPAESARVKLVRSFLATMLAQAPPTVADFERFFGPHDESELLLQLRAAGVHDPLHTLADEATVARVNKRLKTPRARSLYLCFLQHAVSPLDPSKGIAASEATIRQDGRNRVWVDTRLGTLSFEFDGDEAYFNRVAEKGKQPLAAEGFLRVCEPRACCE